MNITDVLLYVLMFVMTQLIGSLVIVLGGSSAWAVCISTLLTIALFLVGRWASINMERAKRHTVTALSLAPLLGLALILPSSWTADLLGFEMPEGQELMLMELMKHPIGALTIVLLAPLSEELVFRGAVLRTLLMMLGGKGTRGCWAAIAISALCFAVAHGNMAQGVHAFLMGLLMGWLYYRTGSILMGMIIHLVNNFTAYAFYAVSGNPELTTKDLFGGNELLMYSLIAVSVAIAVGVIYKLATSKLTK